MKRKNKLRGEIFSVVLITTIMYPSCTTVFAKESEASSTLYEKDAIYSTSGLEHMLASNAKPLEKKGDVRISRTIRVGDFSLGSDSYLLEGRDYEYSNNTLTIKSGVSMVISGSTEDDHIAVENGITANITFFGLDISTNPHTVAFEVVGNATCNLTIERSNSLTSGEDAPGLKVAKGATLNVDGTGSLRATGGSGAAGIGSSYKVDSGSIIIRSGTIIANGYDGGAGIGGGTNGSGGNVEISGGDVTAIGNNGGAGIGIGSTKNNGTFTLAISGGHVIAKGLGDSNQSGLGAGGGVGVGSCTINITGGTIEATGASEGILNGIASGINNHVNISNAIVFLVNGSTTGFTKKNSMIFEGNEGNLYGNSFTLPNDVQIPSSKVLTIANSQRLIVDRDKTLTNNGTIKIKNGGTLDIQGQYTGTGVLDVDAGGIVIGLKASTPQFTTSSTANSISVTISNYETKFGDIEYNWDKQGWTTEKTLSNLKANSSHMVAVRFKGLNFYSPSDEATKTAATTPANYTITIPATTLIAGDNNSNSKISVNTGSSFDLGYTGHIDVNILKNDNVTEQGKLKLKRINDINSTIITSALLVNGKPFTDITKNIATFKEKGDPGVNVSFEKPTETKILAGTYNGTITFGVSYSEN